MLINANLLLQNASGNSRPSPERLNQSPTRPEADSPPAADASSPADQELSVAQSGSNEDTQPLEDTTAADAATNYAKSNILMQPAMALLAQANTLPQTVLDLLQ